MSPASATGSCGYCQTAFGSDSVIAECSNCGTKQHRECWDEYGGCVLPGCTGYDVNRPAPATDSAGMSAQVAAPPSVGQKSGRNTVLISAASILALAVVGIGAFLILNASGSKSQSTYGSPAAGTPASDPVDTDNASSDGEPTHRQLSGKKKTAAALKAMVVKVHRPINNGDWEKSFRYLSSEKQAAKGSVSGWQSAYSGSWSSGASLDMSDVHVSNVVVRNRGKRREAEFTLKIAVSDGGCYEGTTWAVSEDGHWRFEPGTDQHPERENATRMGERPESC